MALSDSVSVGYGGGEPESPHQTPKSPKDQASSPLDRQNSIFSLTLDEIQLKSGRNFGSMNMDEFLTNLWNVDENQVSSQSPPNQSELQPINDNNVIQTDPPTLTRQNSFSIPIQICKKTLDEVWSEIQKNVSMDNIISNHKPLERQQTFGEITLEEFLIKAGVVQEPTTTPKSLSQQQKVDRQPIQINNINNNTCLDASFDMEPNSMIALAFSTHQNVGNDLLVNKAYGAYPIYTLTNTNIVENDKSTHGVLETSGVKNNRKRIIDGPLEMVVERRQRRMIKNRESAARSRARKQAYTVELELELTQLKEENEQLKQTVMELEQKRAQEIFKRNKQSKMARKKGENLKTISRTTSSGW